MTISRTEAAEALSEIERAAGRTQELRGYRISGPIVMLWGVIWIVGYVATGLLSVERWGLIWIPLDLIGFALTILRPTAPNAYLAFPGLVVGALYGLIGIWRMTRYVWIGSAVFVATLVGFFVFPQGLAFWMAATGGGGLLLGGLWMRRA